MTLSVQAPAIAQGLFLLISKIEKEGLVIAGLYVKVTVVDVVNDDC